MTETIQEEYGDTVRERIREQHGELPDMPGEPSIIKLSTDALPDKGHWE